MINEKVETLLEERSQLLLLLSSQASLMRGTWVERYSTCSRPNCECHTGKRHGPRYYLAITQGGKQRQIYVRRSQENTVREEIRQSQEVDRILNQITQINIALMREGFFDDSQQ